MTARKPERPKLVGAPESITPGEPAAPGGTEAPAPVVTATLSIRLPADLVERWNRTVRTFHAETGLPKGEISAELLEEALLRVAEVGARLSAR